MTEQNQFLNKAARLDNALKNELGDIEINVDNIPLATQEKRGAMSSEDKTKLDSLEDYSVKISSLEGEVNRLSAKVLEIEGRLDQPSGE